MSGRATPLLQTKFAIPRGPKAAVGRPRLHDLLAAGVGAAHAGFRPGGRRQERAGQLLDRGRPAPGPVAWLSLDADDADRRRFWRAVCGRCPGHRRRGHRGARRQPREPMSTDLCCPRWSMRSHARAARRPRARRLPRGPVARSREDLERLLRRPRRRCGWSSHARRTRRSRSDALRLDGRADEIRAADLAFTLARGRALFDALGRRARRARRRAALAAHRGLGRGAAAGGALAARPRRPRDASSPTSPATTPRSPTTSSARCSPAAPDDARASCCGRRSSSAQRRARRRADRRRDGARVLDELERAGPFPTPSTATAWFRYHPLFAELLRAGLRAERPASVPELHAARRPGWPPTATTRQRCATPRPAARGTSRAELTINRWVQLLIDGELRRAPPRVARRDSPRASWKGRPSSRWPSAGADARPAGEHASAQRFLSADAEALDTLRSAPSAAPSSPRAPRRGRRCTRGACAAT